MSGGGIGSALGSGLGMLLAPETGGLSMLIPAIGGAAGGALGAGLTHGNPLMSALMGGIGGGFSSAMGVGDDLGISNGAGLWGDNVATGLNGADSAVQGIGTSALDDSAAGNSGTFFGNAAANGSGGLSLDPTLGKSILGDAAQGATSNAANTAAQGTGGMGDLINYLKGKDKMTALTLAGQSLFSGADSLLNPPPKYNVAGNAASVMATNPGFSASLPKYTMQNTATPYAGNWYTYGQSPQTPMYNAMPVPVAQKRGGMAGYADGGVVMPNIGGGANVTNIAGGGQAGIAPQKISNLLTTLKMSSQPQPVQAPVQNPSANPLNSAPMIRPAQFAHGGHVRGYAMGGLPQMPQQSPMGMPQMGQPNPLAAAQTAHKVGQVIGHALGRRLKAGATTPDGRVQGQGTGQSDSIPAKLSKDEYIVPSEVVSQLGDGSSEAGGKALDQMVKNVRKHKTGNSKFPPEARNPLSYIGGA